MHRSTTRLRRAIHDTREYFEDVCEVGERWRGACEGGQGYAVVSDGKEGYGYEGGFWISCAGEREGRHEGYFGIGE